MKKRVLLVDDSLTVRAFEKLALGNMSYEFFEASNGKVGLELARTQKPDVILLDVMMPVMGGVDALKELKGSEETKHIPVIMVTTRSELEVRGACEALGVCEFVLKPIDREQLKSSVLRMAGA